jgi:PAS domain S-box-containing protein
LKKAGQMDGINKGKLDEEAAVRSEQFQNPFLPVLIGDSALRLIAFNEKAKVVFKGSLIPGIPISRFLTPAASFEQVLSSGKLMPGQWFSIEDVSSVDASNKFQVFLRILGTEHCEGFEILLHEIPAPGFIIPDLSQEKRISMLETQLTDLEMRFRTLADNFPQGQVSILDENLQILFSGGLDFQTDKGTFKPKAGENVLDFYGENYAEFLKESLLNCFTGKPDEFELNFGESSYSFHLIPLPDKKSGIRRVMVIIQNISSEKAAILDAHHRREYLRQIIDVDPNFIYVKSRDGRMIVANKTIADFFGIPVKEFLKNSEDWFKRYKWNYDEVKKADETVFASLQSRTSEEAFFHPETGRMHLFQFTRTPFVTRDNELSILCVGVDITDRLNTENELITKQEYLRQVLDTNPSLIFVKEPAGRYLMVNKAFAEQYHMSVEDLTGKTDEDLPLSSVQRKQFADEDQIIAETGTSINLEEESKHPHTGETCHFVVSKKLLLDAEGNHNILGVITDVTDLKMHQDKVEKSEFLLQQIFNKVADALLIIDLETLQIEDGNAKASELFSGNEESLSKRHLHALRPAREAAPEFWKMLLDESVSGTAVAETELLDFSGNVFWGSIAITSFLQESRRLILLRITNISKQKETEEHIIQSLHEKEILIQEIHHRVKNNMAVISSLLQLQSGYLQDDKLAEVFRDSQSRIKSMALIHEKLYQSSTLARVEMESYIKELTRTLYYTYNGGKIHLDVNTKAENVFLDINSAVPCGLIINEVFSNACKHAFIGRNKGVIDILFSREGNFYELEIRDNGIGIPADMDLNNFKSLGMNLVQALASQLGASLDYLRESGFGIRLRFQEKVKPSREKVLPGS